MGEIIIHYCLIIPTKPWVNSNGQGIQGTQSWTVRTKSSRPRSRRRAWGEPFVMYIISYNILNYILITCILYIYIYKFNQLYV